MTHPTRSVIRLVSGMGGGLGQGQLSATCCTQLTLEQSAGCNMLHSADAAESDPHPHPESVFV